VARHDLAVAADSDGITERKELNVQVIYWILLRVLWLPGSQAHGRVISAGIVRSKTDINYNGRRSHIEGRSAAIEMGMDGWIQWLIVIEI
jgi:hypothetical protein